MISNYGNGGRFGFVDQIEEMGEALEESGQVKLEPRFQGKKEAPPKNYEAQEHEAIEEIDANSEDEKSGVSSI